MVDTVKENLLLIFIKNPEKGRVKTRLAESIGDEQALNVYRELLSITKSVTDELNCARQVWYSRFVDEQDQWSGDHYEKKLQVGQNLGQRMKNAFQDGFEEGYQKIVIIGSDCAELDPGILRQSFEALDSNDTVLGPSRDGGYYLLGMNRMYTDLFEDKDWSTPHVFDDTLEQIKKKQLTFRLLPILNDIDTKEDLKNTDQKLDSL